MYYGLEKRCRRNECTSVPKRPQRSRADSPVVSAVASDTTAGLSSGPFGAKGKSVIRRAVGCMPCVRPVEAALMAAGPDEVDGSDPNSLQCTRSAWTPRVSSIPGSTALSSRLTTLHTPLDHRNASAERGFGCCRLASSVAAVRSPAMPRPARTSALTHSIDSQELGNVRCWAYGSHCVLDLGCGYGDFINNVVARRRIAVDSWSIFRNTWTHTSNVW